MDDTGWYLPDDWTGAPPEVWGGAGAGVHVYDGSTRPLFTDITGTLGDTFKAAAGVYTNYAVFQVARLRAEAAIAQARAALSATPLATWLLLGGAAVAVFYLLKK